MRSLYSNWLQVTAYTLLLLLPFYAQAAHNIPPPNLSVNTEGLQVSLHWTESKNTAYHRVFYAPYPYQGKDSIESLDLGKNTSYSIKLPPHASYYIAVKSYDKNNQSSEYSNIEFIQITDRGEDYRHFWKTTIKEIDEKHYVSDDFLYLQLPNLDACFIGSLTEQAKNREEETLNQIRSLHQLPSVQYNNNWDIEVLSAALIQRSNDFLMHSPNENSKCYSQTGFDGSNSSNLGLVKDNIDPAKDLINLIDDAANISTIGAVGHRRHLLNPFLKYTSYGQIYGASAIKVFDFSTSSPSTSVSSPSFVAFPYLRYPYVFLSDTTSDKNTPWNLSIIEDSASIWGNQHDYFSTSKVTVTQKSNNHRLPAHHLFSDTKGTGIPNNLSWMVDGWQYDTWYTVLIENINYQFSQKNSLEYDVYIDYKNFFNTKFPVEKGDSQQNNNLIQGTLFNIEDKDSFEVTLNGKITFKGKSQFSNTAFFIEIYNINKKLLKASDSPFTLDLPNALYTIVISNCYNNTCYSERKKYRLHISNDTVL